jgi:hypothetical protein
LALVAVRVASLLTSFAQAEYNLYIQTQHTIPRHSSTAMSMRNTSGKFTIPFGRKSDKTPASPTGTGPTHGRFFSSGGGSGDDDFGPGGEKGSGSGGLNIGKRIAHQRLIPGLGNQDLRQLQE